MEGVLRSSEKRRGKNYSNKERVLRIISFPRHALYEKRFQRQKGVGPLVGSQEHRAPLVPRLNRLSNAGQPLISFLRLFLNTNYIVCSCFRRKRSEQCSRFAGGQEGGSSLGRIDPTASRPTLFRPAPLPRRASPRPDRPVVSPGFGFDTFFEEGELLEEGGFLKELSSFFFLPGHALHLSIPIPGHTTGESGRGARRGGGAGSGRTGCQQNCSPRGQASLAPSKASKKRFLDVSPEARTSEIPCKPMEEQNPRGKGLQRQNVSVHWSAARNKERFSSRGYSAVQLRFNRGFCSSIGLHRISLVRASGETRKRVFDALEGTREACFMVEQFCWHPVLPDPAPPLRRALRPEAPMVCMVGFWIRQARSRRSKDCHLRSAKPNIEEPSFFNLRSSRPNIEESPIFDLRP